MSAPGSRQKKARARRAWDRILINLQNAAESLPDIQESKDLSSYLDLLVDASNKLRAAIKLRRAASFKEAV
jgi:hypothetical protein